MLFLSETCHYPILFSNNKCSFTISLYHSSKEKAIDKFVFRHKYNITFLPPCSVFKIRGPCVNLIFGKLINSIFFHNSNVYLSFCTSATCLCKFSPYILGTTVRKDIGKVRNSSSMGRNKCVPKGSGNCVENLFLRHICRPAYYLHIVPNIRSVKWITILRPNTASLLIFDSEYIASEFGKILPAKISALALTLIAAKPYPTASAMTSAPSIPEFPWYRLSDR